MEVSGKISNKEWEIFMEPQSLFHISMYFHGSVPTTTPYGRHSMPSSSFCRKRNGVRLSNLAQVTYLGEVGIRICL